MSKRLSTFLLFSLLFSLSAFAEHTSSGVTAAGGLTDRVPQFYNEKVNVWRTVIYPGPKEMLPMHRHENDRVIVALTDGTLKQVTDKGTTETITLKKNTAIYLKKDIPGEQHSDENMGTTPIEMMVIEVK